MKSLFIALTCAITIRAAAQDVTRYVDPFIGTEGGGNTFPGAVVPWGMVSVSPHTSPGSPSGYIHGEKYFYGFGYVHLSGTGCADLGSIAVTASASHLRTEPEEYRCRFTEEYASPGYYRLKLDDPKLLAEVTATSRCGITMITPSSDGAFEVIIDAGRSLGLQGGGAIRVHSPSEASGYNIAGGICGENNRQPVYFDARLSEAADSAGIWVGKNAVRRDSASTRDSAVGCWFRFQGRRNHPVLSKVGISYVSTNNARLNVETEAPGWNFEKFKSDAAAAWQAELSRIRLDGGTRDDLVKFYTALYHMLIHPNIISDVNGEYPRMGHTGTGRYEGRERYTVFSLWDTYRTLHPFLTLVYPERQSAIVRTMIDMYRESGWLPKWELAANETHLMVGDPAVPVIADTYLKGVSDFNIDAAYDAMKKPAALAGSPEALPMRPGYHEMLKYGYIPFEQDTNQAWWVWGPVSTTLEYCLDDWALAQVARRTGRTQDAELFTRRSLLYRLLFDSTSQFIRPKLRNGSWLEPFDPRLTEGSGSWSGSGGPGYVEGNAWQYSWFVPHDIPGLISLFGGPARFVAKLEECFAIGQFTINNEPDIAYPYLFTYIPGEETRTQRHVREIMRTQFGTGPAGLPGNDDAGTISGWYVFSALGFYPACPGSTSYRLGVPAFPKATIALNPEYYPGKEFTVATEGALTESSKIRVVKWNGRPLPDYSISHSDLVSGGSLVFVTVR